VQFDQGHLHGMCCYWHSDGQVDQDRSGFYRRGQYLKNLAGECPQEEQMDEPARCQDLSPCPEGPVGKNPSA